MASPSTSSDDGIVRVTLNTVYQQQLSTQVDLAEIKGTLLLLSQNMTHVIDTGKDHEQRLRELEKAAVAQTEFDQVEKRVAAIESSALTKAGMYAFLGVAIAACSALAVVISLATR